MRMKRARRRMAVAEMVARTERKRSVPSMVVVFAVLAVRERLGGGVYLKVGERRGDVRRREREEGYWVRAKSYLVFLRRRQLSIAPSSSRRPSSVLIARVWLNGHAYSISGYTFPLHDDATRHFAETRIAGPIDH